MGFAVLLIVLLLALVALPIWALIRVQSIGTELRVWQARVAVLEEELRRLRQRVIGATSAEPPASTPAPALTPLPPAAPHVAPAAATPPPVATAAPPLRPTPAPALSPVPPPLVRAPAARELTPPQPAPRPAAKPVINLEQFVGAKLFAWLGGLAGFLAVGFFVKYSFEHDLIPPEVRVSIGFLLAAALIVTGLWIKAEKLRVTSQVLCATGIVSLYAVTFACHAVYHFAPFTPLFTFGLMALITGTAFLLAGRQEAQVVALLGLLGGFLTPWLLSTGEDNALALFGYVALLDLGLLAVALRRRWHYLVPLAAAGTVLMEAGWMNAFFSAPRAPLAMAICLGFGVLFQVGAELARRARPPAPYVTWSAVGLGFVAFAFAAYFISLPAVAVRAPLLFSFIFAADALLLVRVWRDEAAGRADYAAGAAAFMLLSGWLGVRLTNALLPAALVACVVFAVLHTAYPLLLDRRRPAANPVWGQAFPPLALALLLIPLFRLSDVSFAFWPAVLLIDAIAIALALFSRSLFAVAAVLLLTLIASGIAICRLPVDTTNPVELFVVVGGFAVFFCAFGWFARRHFSASAVAGGSASDPSNAALGAGPGQISTAATLLPFLLLVIMSQRLSFPQPGALFGMALLLTVLALGLARLLVLEWLPACALAGVALVEYSWASPHFTTAHAPSVLVWFLGFHALFAAYPFCFRATFARCRGPWIAAALSGAVQFGLVYKLVRDTWPNDVMGLLPLLFALPPLASLVAVLRTPAADPARRLDQLAWFGGVALLFITLVFPIQFDRQWITLGWALEGVALLWLFLRVPHPGLRATGVALLAVAFLRLAANPAVLGYHHRGGTPILNWYLYTYGIVTLALLVGAHLLRRGASGEPVRVFGIPAVGMLQALGAVLGFLLLNIEIADFFSTPGSRLMFDFSGNFARDMSYTVGWALYALLMLGAGIWRRSRPARLAAIALLGAALLKLFFHDLAQLGQLYRVGALVGVAAVAIVASFLYQRFVPTDEPH